MVAFVEQDHEWSGVGWERERFGGFGYVGGVELGSTCSSDFDIDRSSEEADVAGDFLSLLYGKCDLVFFSVVGVGEMMPLIWSGALLAPAHIFVVVRYRTEAAG